MFAFIASLSSLNFLSRSTNSLSISSRGESLDEYEEAIIGGENDISVSVISSATVARMSHTEPVSSEREITGSGVTSGSATTATSGRVSSVLATSGVSSNISIRDEFDESDETSIAGTVSVSTSVSGVSIIDIDVSMSVIGLSWVIRESVSMIESDVAAVAHCTSAIEVSEGVSPLSIGVHPDKNETPEASSEASE